VISERLGHATIAVTMDIYSHVLPGLDREAADTVARLILGGGNGVSEASVNKPLTSGHTGEGDQDGEARSPSSGGCRRADRNSTPTRVHHVAGGVALNRDEPP
jgi:hypothetical protein